MTDPTAEAIKLAQWEVAAADEAERALADYILHPCARTREVLDKHLELIESLNNRRLRRSLSHD